MALRDARRAQGRSRRGSVPRHAPRARPRVPGPSFGRAPRDRRALVRDRGRGDAQPGRRHRGGALSGRGAQRALALHAGGADRGHHGRRDGADPLHVGDDEGPEGRRPHARATRGRSACRRATGSTRTSTTSSGARPARAGRRRSGTCSSARGRTAPRSSSTRARSTPRSDSRCSRGSASPSSARRRPSTGCSRSSTGSAATYLPRLRHAVSAGEPLNPEVIERFQDALGLTIYDGYGQTENSLLVANNPETPVRPGSMGLPTPGPRRRGDRRRRATSARRARRAISRSSVVRRRCSRATGRHPTTPTPRSATGGT